MAKILKSRRFQGSEMYSRMSWDQISLHSFQIFPVGKKNHTWSVCHTVSLSNGIMHDMYNMINKA